MYIAVAIGVAAILYAANISSQSAHDYINGVELDSNVRPGSGEFFDSVASRYDILNQIISLGHDMSWRKLAIQKVLPAESVLDVSTGTADLAITMAVNRSMRIVGIDPSSEMLAIGRQKIARAKGLIGDVELIQGVVEDLPFPDESFHGVIVGFGVRNFEDRLKGLSEMARVLQPEGKMVILENTIPTGNDIKSRCTRFFISYIMPRIAGMVSGNTHGYMYLSESMAEFPQREEFSKILKHLGLDVQEYQRLSPLGMGPELYVATKVG